MKFMKRSGASIKATFETVQKKLKNLLTLKRVFDIIYFRHEVMLNLIGSSPVKSNNLKTTGCSAVGSASGLGPEGRWFESSHPELNAILHFAGIAQLVERHLAKVDVAGSSPVSRSHQMILVAPVAQVDRAAAF